MVYQKYRLIFDTGRAGWIEVTEVKVRVPVGNVSIYKYVVSTSTSSTSTVVLVVVQVPGSVGTRDKVPGYHTCNCSCTYL